MKELALTWGWAGLGGEEGNFAERCIKHKQTFTDVQDLHDRATTRTHVVTPFKNSHALKAPREKYI